MYKENKTGRLITNNVDYFAHIYKDAKELITIQHKYKPERYEALYRLAQCLGDAEFYRIDLKNILEKKILEYVFLYVKY